ncbi:galactose-6-phosphate isomerase subunit LacA [Streptococcus pyogenes]|nr:galactose-6-phosphate isomerase subunit LacA [Streptococcus pyogenes]
MAIILGADAHGNALKELIKSFLQEEGYDIIDVTDINSDFIDNTLAVAKAVNEAEGRLGIMVDAYGAGPFMVATKLKGMVAAEVSDERSAYMTRGHNRCRDCRSRISEEYRQRFCDWSLRWWSSSNSC